MAVHSAAVIDQDEIGLAWRRSQSASCHLPEQTDLFGRSSKNDAADRRQVEAFGQDHAVTDDLGLAGRQPGKDCIALAFGRAAIQMLGANAGFDEFVLHVDAVGNVDTEHQSLLTLAMFVPVGNDVADQIITVHPIGELVDDVIALPGLDAV